MKVDIEKIKNEYQEKIQEAIAINNILDFIGDDSFRVYITKGYINKSKKRLRFCAEKLFDKLDITKVGLILDKIPATEKVRVYLGSSGYLDMDYELCTSRGYRDSFSTLSIRYIHKDYEVVLELPIEPNKQLNGYFVDSLRKVTDYEITSYYIVSRPNMKAANVKVPTKLFANGEYIHFQGGHVTCKTEFAANNIIDAIKESNVNK